MIIKYPIFLLLILPLVALVTSLKIPGTTHTIAFPKAAWMKSLASKGLSNVKNISDHSSFNIDIDNDYIGTTTIASSRKADH